MERANMQTGKGGGGEKSESKGAMQLWIIQSELKGGRDGRRGEIGSGSHYSKERRAMLKYSM